MDETRGDPHRRIRVVLFGGGPALERGVRRFLRRLEGSPEIELLGGFIQAERRGGLAVLADGWRRRGFLVVPVLLRQAANGLGRLLADPHAELELNRELERLSGRIHFVPDIHAGEVLDRVRELAPDLGLVYGSPILKPELFEIPRWGTLGIHHGKVPEYRGKKTAFWAMYNGEKTAGVTIQKVGAGLDTGEIVKEGEVSIARKSFRAVWEELELLGLDLYLEAILEVKRGTARCRPQTGKKGKLYRDPRWSDLVRFWWRRAA